MSFPLETNPETESPAAPYRSLCPAAVASVVVAVLAIPTLVFWQDWSWAVMPLAGAFLGWRALVRIRNAPLEQFGLELARLGIVLSGVVLVGGYVWLYFYGNRGIPYGYDVVTYDKLQPDRNAPAEPVPQKALDMQDKRVFIQGYIQPRRSQTGIKEFVLCPTNGSCPFCIPNPKKTEMIRVVLQGDLETSYTTHLIGVGGRFQVDPADPSGIPYGLEADFLR